MRRWSLLILLLVASAAAAAVRLGGATDPEDSKTEVVCDLPQDQRIKNIGSHVDGYGMCVMSSIEMAARWQGLEQLRGLRDWCARQPGGGYPSKVDRQLKEYCRSKGIDVPRYVQEEGVGAERVRAVLDTGRMACVTYSGQDGVRYRGPIAHMVCAVLVSPRRTCLLDNNGIGPDELLWMDLPDFDRRFRGNGGSWLFYWLAPPPPPVPRN